MGLMDAIRRWNESRKEKSNTFKEMQDNRRFQKIIESREKSSEERQLERYLEEERQKRIKAELDKFNQKKTKELWKGDYAILNKQQNILKEDKKILTKENIFLDNKTKIPFVQRSMYFN